MEAILHRFRRRSRRRLDGSCGHDAPSETIWELDSRAVSLPDYSRSCPFRQTDLSKIVVVSLHRFSFSALTTSSSGVTATISRTRRLSSPVNWVARMSWIWSWRCMASIRRKRFEVTAPMTPLSSRRFHFSGGGKRSSRIFLSFRTTTIGAPLVDTSLGRLLLDEDNRDGGAGHEGWEGSPGVHTT